MDLRKSGFGERFQYLWLSPLQCVLAMDGGAEALCWGWRQRLALDCCLTATEIGGCFGNLTTSLY